MNDRVKKAHQELNQKRYKYYVVDHTTKAFNFIWQPLKGKQARERIAIKVLQKHKVVESHNTWDVTKESPEIYFYGVDGINPKYRDHIIKEPIPEWAIKNLTLETKENIYAFEMKSAIWKEYYNQLRDCVSAHKYSDKEENIYEIFEECGAKIVLFNPDYKFIILRFEEDSKYKPKEYSAVLDEEQFQRAKQIYGTSGSLRGALDRELDEEERTGESYEKPFKMVKGWELIVGDGTC